MTGYTDYRRGWWITLATAVLFFITGLSTAQAIPTRNEVYRSDRLKVTVFKDSQDPEVFWYIPPVRLYEENGSVVHYRRAKGDRVDYHFYVVPYMNDDLVELLSGEIPGIQNKTQLKPIIARQFGIQVKQFNAVAMGDQITDYQYLNQPQLVQVNLSQTDADEFEFFIKNKPGVQANVLFHYETERMDKYLTIELSYREVYNALNIGATGKYRFTKGEIAQGVENYVSKKYFNVKSKGDLQIPDIVNKVIEECFTPYSRKSNTKKKDNGRWRDWEDWLINDPKREEVLATLEYQESLLDALELDFGMTSLGGTWDPSGGKKDDLGWGDESNDDDKPGRGGSGGGKETKSLEFTFKKEMANSDKAFYYRQEHFVDSSEITAIPIYLSLAPVSMTSKVLVTPMPKRDLVVENPHTKTDPLRTGIMVGDDEQYIISAVFSYSARSHYRGYKLAWYRWFNNWPSTSGDLYYRIGNGPWNPVNGRTVIKTESIYRGELQFYLDRQAIWDKISSDYKETKMLGLVPAIFTYKRTYPQFNVVINGRRIQLQ